MTLTKRSDSPPSLASKLKAQAQSVRRKIPGGGQREHLVMLLDVSGSMEDPCDDGSKKISALEQAAQEFVKATSKVVCELEMFKFSGETTRIYTDMITRFGFHLCTEWSGTNIHGALSIAANRLAFDDKSRSHRVVLMSDGMPTQSMNMIFDEVKKTYAEKGIPIDTVAFGMDADKDFLRELSRMTGGKFQEASDMASLIRSFKLLETRARGLLTAGSDGPEATGR